MSTLPVVVREPERAEHTTSSRAESTARRFFAVACLVCFLLYLLPFVSIRFHLAPRWTTSYWGQVIDTSYYTAHQDADVVIFGDSTAATNVDPVLMSRDLGVKVLVLPSVSTSLPVVGFTPLERYLRTNKQPRLIIFYLSGWDLDFLYSPFTGIVDEGQEMLLMHASWSEIFHYFKKHPRKVLMFPLHFYASSNRLADLAYLRPHEDPRMAQGHIVQLGHETPMDSNCDLDALRMSHSAADTSVREGVQRFTRPGTQTVVVISPLPNCKHIEVMQRVAHPGLDIAPLQILSPRRFREDSWQAHMLTEAIGPSTEYLEKIVRTKLGPAGPSAEPGPSGSYSANFSHLQ